MPILTITTLILLLFISSTLTLLLFFGRQVHYVPQTQNDLVEPETRFYLHYYYYYNCRSRRLSLRSAMTTIRFIIMPDNRLVQVDWSVSIYFAKNDNDRRTDIFLCAIRTNIWRISSYRLPVVEGPRVVVSTAAFHARVRGSDSAVWKKQKCFFPIHVWKSVLRGASVIER